MQSPLEMFISLFSELKGFAWTGKDCFFTITLNPGYRILDVKDNGVSKGPVSSYEITNIHETHTIEATFTAIYGPSTTQISSMNTRQPTLTAPTLQPLGGPYNLEIIAVGSTVLAVITALAIILMIKKGKLRSLQQK